MTKLRAISLVTVLTVGLLSGCTKPNPGATVFSGAVSAHREALCWSADAAVTPENCAQDIVDQAMSGPDVATIPVTHDQTMGISVDKAVAENGWFVSIGGQRLNDKPITETYYRFTFPSVTFPADGYQLQVIAAGKGNATRGLWVFKLTEK